MTRITLRETALATLTALAVAAGTLWASAAPLTLVPKKPPARDFSIANPDAVRCDLRRNPANIFADLCDTKPDPLATLDAHYEPRESVSW